MSDRNYILLLLLCFMSLYVSAQKNNTMSNTNPLLCDPEDGICATDSNSTQTNNTPKPVKIIYFTDPICSSCWGIEPQLRKLKLEYGAYIDIEYHMGGLLPDWSYNSGGISKPSDVAHHWDEVSQYYQMPIDGDVWLEDPLHSSYPPSIAFKAAQMQSEEKALLFLRVIREMVFLHKKNITKWEHLENAAVQVGLDPKRLETDMDSIAEQHFQADLALARQYGVRGFPTLLVTDGKGKQNVIYGFKPYAQYIAAIRSLHPDAEALPYDKSWKGLFKKFGTLTTREFAELSDQKLPEANKQLTELWKQNKLNRHNTKNGPLWLGK